MEHRIRSGRTRGGAGVLSGLLMLGALLSGLARRSVLSLAPLFVVARFVLGPGATGVLHFNARSGFVSDLATAALIVILFRDGLEVKREHLQSHWHLPLRKLAIGMPITAAVIAAVAHLAVGLQWLRSFLLGALLSPTDPVLSSAVVTDRRVPRLIRHSLNLESGLNDGLALPAVLALAAALDASQRNFVWWHFALQDLLLVVTPASSLSGRGVLLLSARSLPFCSARMEAGDGTQGRRQAC